MKFSAPRLGLLVLVLSMILACSEKSDQRASPPGNAAEQPASPPGEMKTRVSDSAGQVNFNRLCAPCHAAGEGHGGTMRLAERAGADKAVLTQRSDLQAPYISAIVRNGLGMMPAFRPTEISDSELAELAAWLAKAGKS